MTPALPSQVKFAHAIQTVLEIPQSLSLLQDDSLAFGSISDGIIMILRGFVQLISHGNP